MTLPVWGESSSRWLKLDCRNYRGDRPCAAGLPGFCPQRCSSYQGLGRRILIIKLGALGDVIRTAALLPGLKESYPQSQLTWVTRPAGVRALAHHPLIDRLLPFEAETLLHLEHERFDLCLSLDKEPGPTALAMRIDARERRGIGLSAYGTPFPLNAECVHYFRLGLDDDLKFRANRQTYPELLYAALGMRYRGQRYEVYPSADDAAHAQRCWSAAGVAPTDVVIGLNTGAGRVFANKCFTYDQWLDVIRALVARASWRIALLGGPEERDLNARLAAAVPGLLNTGTNHTELQFAALVRRCAVLVAGDTLALHLAVAQRTPCVALFGPTCPAEIDLFERGEKLVSPAACAPCYRHACDKEPTCMQQIAPASVASAVERWVSAPRASISPVETAEVSL